MVGFALRIDPHSQEAEAGTGLSTACSFVKCFVYVWCSRAEAENRSGYPACQTRISVDRANQLFQWSESI